MGDVDITREDETKEPRHSGLEHKKEVGDEILTEDKLSINTVEHKTGNGTGPIGGLGDDIQNARRTAQTIESKSEGATTRVTTVVDANCSPDKSASINEATGSVRRHLSAGTAHDDDLARGDVGSDTPEVYHSHERAEDKRTGLTTTDENSSRRDEVGGDNPSNDPTSTLATPEWPDYCDPAYRMPAKIAVKVHINSEVKNISVKVERFTEEKAFEGGYRHRQTGRIFHHASTQFGQWKKVVKQTGHLRARDTQTCKVKSTTVQTTNEYGTQVSFAWTSLGCFDRRSSLRSVTTSCSVVQKLVMFVLGCHLKCVLR